MPIFGQKTSILSTKLFYIFGQKVNRMPFFSDFWDFSHTVNCFHIHILSKKRLFSQKHNALISIFCQKTSILSKPLCSHVILCTFFMKTPLRSCPYLVKKSTILSKLHFIFYYGSKKSIKCPFFLIFHEKCLRSYPFSDKKTSFIYKTKCSRSHILSKKCQFSQKHGILVSFLSI